MNNLGYTSYAQNVVHNSVSISDMAETTTGMVPEAFDSKDGTENILPSAQLKTNGIDQPDDSNLSAYQPIAHGSILPVHRLLF